MTLLEIQAKIAANATTIMTEQQSAQGAFHEGDREQAKEHAATAAAAISENQALKPQAAAMLEAEKIRQGLADGEGEGAGHAGPRLRGAIELRAIEERLDALHAITAHLQAWQQRLEQLLAAAD